MIRGEDELAVGFALSLGPYIYLRGFAFWVFFFFKLLLLGVSYDLLALPNV